MVLDMRLWCLYGAWHVTMVLVCCPWDLHFSVWSLYIVHDGLCDVICVSISICDDIYVLIYICLYMCVNYLLKQTKKLLMRNFAMSFTKNTRQSGYVAASGASWHGLPSVKGLTLSKLAKWRPLVHSGTLYRVSPIQYSTNGGHMAAAGCSPTGHCLGFAEC